MDTQRDRPLFVEERQRQILQALRTRGKVTVEELCQQFGVSAPTVRADLAALEASRLLRRTHGGALPGFASQHEPPYSERAGESADEKRRIGLRAAQMIGAGETVILDAGTTTHEIGLALARLGTPDVTVLTNNLPTALHLMEVPHLTTLVIGGQIQPRRRATLGPLAVEFMLSVRADRVFLGVSGVDAQGGLTAADFDAAQVKRAMLKSASQVVVVADSSKIGQTAFAHIAPVLLADCLLTDVGLPDTSSHLLQEAGITEVVRC